MAKGKVAISVKDIRKNFILPHEKNSSIKSGIVNIFRKRNKGADVQKALRGITFDIKEGEFFGILGRNGSGKSTLLKILAEIYQPTSGSIKTHGRLVPFIELGVGFNPELTGRENVYLNGALLGFSKAEIEERYEDIVEFAELRDFMDQKLKNYSSGMQVRLAFSVATRAEADILLVDEVLAVGDADFQRKCYDYFKSLKRTGKTVILVTHDMGAVKEYCDRAVLINEGVISSQGTANKVADEYLKLFNHSQGEFIKKDENRWGTGQITIDAIDAKFNKEEIVLDVDLVADQRGAEDYVFGYRLVNAEGRVVAGGNSLNARNGKRLSLRPNQKAHLKFVIDNVLGSGTISLSATVRLSDGATVCDNWDDILNFNISREESYYPIIMSALLEESQ